MKLFVENWRKHLQEQDNIKLQNAILTEISQNDYEMIKNWMVEAGDEAYSFNNLFNGKKRIAIPVETGVAKGPIGQIVNFFKNNGWEINFKDSTVSKRVRTTIPKGPREGEKVTKIKKMRIGKALDRAADLIAKYMSAEQQYNHARADKSAVMADLMAATGTPIEDNPKIIAARKAIDRALEAQDIPYQHLYREFPYTIEKQSLTSAANAISETFLPFWSEKAEYYRQNPEEAFEKKSPFVTILSRHPVDVVRMSDMNNIRSCHRREGGYFQCAVAESRGHGPIAYLVPRKQFEQYFDVDLSETNPEDVDLDAGGEEIFEDDNRGVPGLRPEGRVRLRKFVGPDKQQVAVPERQTYAPHGGRTPPNFLKGVTAWALENQKETIGDPKEIELNDWYRTGGSHEDTLDGDAFAELLRPIIDDETFDVFTSQGNIDHEYEDEEEIQAELEGGSVEARAEGIQEWADENLKHLGVYHEIMDDDDQPRIYYSSGVEFDLGDFGEPTEGDWDDHEEEVTDIIMDVFEDYGVYPERGNVELYGDEWRTTIDPAYDDEPTPEGFESFVESLKGGDDNWESIIEDIHALLIERNLMVPQLTQAAAQFKTYRNIVPQINQEENKVSVFLKNPVVLNNNPRSFKQHDITTQEKIKALFREYFSSQVRRSLFDLYSENTGNTPYSFDPFKQGLHIDLDGVKLKFQLDFDYTKDADFDPIKRFLNMLNINNNFEAFRRLAERAYFQALAGAMKDQGKEKSTPEPEEETPPIKENLKRRKVSDKMLFESWRGYLGK